jgi:hypothetical protein
MLELREQICEHINKSISNKQYSEELSFPIPEKTVKRIKAILHLNMQNYTCIIKSHDVRHVYKRHPNDVEYICEIPKIIQKFYKVNKSITKDNKTGSALVNLEFYKNYENNIVKLVKLKIHSDKRLELKTIFIKD